jgi:uncharacterized membrane protein
MITENTVAIDEPAAAVWDVFTDVERWAEWTASIDHITALDGPGLAAGKRFEIKQPRLPKVVWEVTEVQPGASWTWRQHSPGATTLASHYVTALDADHTRVDQRIDQRGPLGVVVGVLTGRLTRRYLDLEAKGLKSRSEQNNRPDASTA